MNALTRTIPRWMLLALAVAFLLLLTFGGWFYRAQEHEVRRLTEKQFSSIARLKVNQIVNWRNERLDDAAQAVDNPFLADGLARYLANPHGRGTEEILIGFQNLAAHGQYSDVLLADTSGRIRLSLSGETSRHDGYAIAMGRAFCDQEPVFTDLYIEKPDTAPHISIIAPVFRSEKRKIPIGAVILDIDAGRYLYPLIGSWPVPSRSAETQLLRRDGDDVLFLNNLPYNPHAALNLRVPLDQNDVLAVMAVEGREGLVESRDHRGVETVADIHPIPDSPWFIVVKEDASEVFATWHLHAELMVALMLALAGVLGAVGLTAWQRNQKAHFRELFYSEARLRASVERHSITLKAVGDGIIATDKQGRVEMLNPVAEELTGWSMDEALGKPLEEIFPIISEITRKQVLNPVEKVLRKGLVVSLANHTLLINRNGKEIPVADSAAPIHDDNGKVTGVVLVFRDQTEERRAHRLMQARVNLLEFAATHTIDETLTRALDEIDELVESPIGFYAFMEEDQKTISLQQWSTRTTREFCKITDGKMRYSLDEAGVWADCVRNNRPTVHNDYQALPNKRGLPEGHAEVVRELVVPIIRSDRTVAIVGIGNKPTEYTEMDVETVIYLADVTWQILEQKRTEAKQRESELQFRAIYDSVHVGIAQVSLDYHIQRANPAYCELLGYTEDELIGMHLRDVTAPEIVESNLEWQKRLVDGAIDHYEMEKRFVRKDGQLVQGIIGATLIRNTFGQPAYTIGTVVDVTQFKQAEIERKKLRSQLNQAQKMESVGRLAGGVAHDFNNMLEVIIGHSEMALEQEKIDQNLQSHLQEILNAAVRSSDLTRQLLAFARKQTIAPKVLDLNETVEGMLKMMRRLIGEDIELVWLPGKSSWSIKMDPTQIDQILANLCVNARDAIDGVGRLAIETGQASIDRSYCEEHPEAFPGDYMMLAVSGNGCGMTRDVMDKLFEPFFTTKKKGEGTGLGLATVYGIVKQNNGFVNVYSEPNEGTTFRIYLPRHEGKVVDSPGEGLGELAASRGETVLLVEDEPAILKLARNMLEKLGYVVLAARTANAALEYAGEQAEKIQILVTDVVMPDMNGSELSKQLTNMNSKMKTLFMSGYTANVIAHRGVLDEGVHFIQKPFTTKSFAAKIREVLDQE